MKKQEGRGFVLQSGLAAGLSRLTVELELPLVSSTFSANPAIVAPVLPLGRWRNKLHPNQQAARPRASPCPCLSTGRYPKNVTYKHSKDEIKDRIEEGRKEERRGGAAQILNGPCSAFHPLFPLAEISFYSPHFSEYFICWGWSDASRWHCRYQRIKRRPRRSRDEKGRGGKKLPTKWPMARWGDRPPGRGNTERRRGPTFREIQYLPSKRSCALLLLVHFLH